ncbi:hypothetical protein [Chondromyces apiculatus]|uniref:Uncharacterized protein n=1 Tax=Chondromyces apiculatus DSM 436 TaxID=1192034 RepID=A0A017T4G9_9BACT|nr:hypothetical protein [Chondromyces apiculatus]EYF04109.1 Hypothetical protein CAP_4792 [Chondromyces apiculatus DSM 436]
MLRSRFPPARLASRTLLLLTLASATASGCALVLGLDDYGDQASGTGGDGGTGGTGGDGPVSCTPGVEEACYSGPDGTEGVGLCKGGDRVCNDTGDAWGICEGEVAPAVEQCAAATDENCDGLECIVWATAYQQDGAVEIFGNATDPEGNVLVAGFFTGVITVGDQTLSSAGSTDGLLLKLRPSGEVAWAMKIGDILEDMVGGVTTDATGNIYISGRLTSDIDVGGGVIGAGLYVAKLDPDGGYLWSTSLGGDGVLIDVVVDGSGDVIAAGFFNEPITGNDGQLSPAGGDDILVIKADGASGSIAAVDGGWVLAVGDAADQTAYSVAVDASKNVFVSGYFEGTIDFGGFSTEATAVAGAADGFLVKITPGGSGSWLETLSGSGYQEIYGVVIDAQGRPTVAGQYTGSFTAGADTLTAVDSADAFAVHFSATREILWAKSFGGAGYQGARALALDAEGNILVGGYASDAINLGGDDLTVTGDSVDGFIAKLTPSGDHLWSRLISTDEDDAVNALAISPDQETVAACVTGAENPDFGTGPLGAAENSNQRLVIAKFGR